MFTLYYKDNNSDNYLFLALYSLLLPHTDRAKCSYHFAYLKLDMVTEPQAY